MQTRARTAVSSRACALPHELWQLILSFLGPVAAVRAALVCSEFAAICQPAAAEACRRLWPQHAQRLAAFGGAGIQRFMRLVSAHEAEAAAHPDVGQAAEVQKLVCREHRQIAVEWLIEVSWDWQLENTVVYRGTQYLDHYLTAHAVPALSKFQMLAISCLRAALKHSSRLTDGERQRLACKHWAEVTDGACTEAEVRSTCTKLERMLQPAHRSHPSAKQRLRCLWYRLFDAGAVKQEQVYVYMLASFLLHVSLLDAQLSAITPTKLATAALSLSLHVFGAEPMPPALKEHCLYTEQELREVHAQLQRAQEELVAPQLRALWLTSYSYTGPSSAQQPAYSHLQRIVSARCKLEVFPGFASKPGKQQQQAGSPAAAGTPLCASAAAAAAGGSATPGSSGQAFHRVMTRACSQRQAAAAAAAAAYATATPSGAGTSSALTRAQYAAAAAVASSAAAAAGAQQAHVPGEAARAEAADHAGAGRHDLRALPHLPLRRAAASSRYGGSSTPTGRGSSEDVPAAAVAAAAGGAASSSQAAALTLCLPEAGSSSRHAAGMGAAAAADTDAGPSSSTAAALAVPASPKHAPGHAGTSRGLGAALFASSNWAAHGGLGGADEGGSSSSRLLSSIPAPIKPAGPLADASYDAADAGTQETAAPALLLLHDRPHSSLQQQQQRSLAPWHHVVGAHHHAGGGSSSSFQQQQQQHLPIARSTRRATLATNAAADLATASKHALVAPERPGTKHTRSTSGGGGGGSSADAARLAGGGSFVRPPHAAAAAAGAGHHYHQQQPHQHHHLRRRSDVPQQLL